jgi:glycerophosphoryl diester phosphodiesterase
MPPGLELIAHRGMPRLARENSLRAFELALEAGADGIELDVHVAADAVVVVHHDSRLGDNGPWLAELEARELARYGVPTLDEVCEHVGTRAVLYVEAKARASAASIIECLTAQNVRAAVHSFDPGVIEATRAIAPALPVGLLVSQSPADAAGVVREHALRDLWPSRDVIDVRLVDSAHSVGARVIAWTVNDANEARRLREIGVDGLCSDDITVLRAALNGKG